MYVTIPFTRASFRGRLFGSEGPLWEQFRLRSGHLVLPMSPEMAIAYPDQRENVSAQSS